MPCLCTVQLRMCAHDVYVLLAGCVCVYVRVLLAGCVCVRVCVHIIVCTYMYARTHLPFIGIRVAFPLTNN